MIGFRLDRFDQSVRSSFQNTGSHNIHVWLSVSATVNLEEDGALISTAIVVGF